MDFLKNIAISLQATGPAAVIIAWIISVTALGLFGDGSLAKTALSILAVNRIPCRRSDSDSGSMAGGQHPEAYECPGLMGKD